MHPMTPQGVVADGGFQAPPSAYAPEAPDAQAAIAASDEAHVDEHARRQP